MCLCGILVGSYSNLQIVDQVDVRLQIRRYPPRKYHTKTISFNVTLGPSIKVKILLFSIFIWFSTLYLICQVNHGNSEIEIKVANEALNLIVTQNNVIQYPSSCLDRFRSDENLSAHPKNRSESPPPNYDEVMLSSTSANNTPPPPFEMC